MISIKQVTEITTVSKHYKLNPIKPNSLFHPQIRSSGVNLIQIVFTPDDSIYM